MNYGLDGKVALVTGAGQHIGAEICHTLSREGASVVVTDYFVDRAETVAAAIRDAGGKAVALKADVTLAEDAEKAVAAAISELGGLHILVNNAGISPKGTATQFVTFAQSTRENWDGDIQVVQYGVLNFCKAVLPHFQEQHYGKIINIISDAGRVGEPRLSTYSMAKGGVVAFSKALAKEVGKDRINVNCVSPGATPPPDREGGRDPERQQAIMRAYPIARGLGRLGIPSDLANAVAYFASDVSEFATGQLLSVSGGYSMVD